MTQVQIDPNEKMRPYSSLARCCEPCLKTPRAGKILRTIVVLSNILYWFAGCAIFSISIWLRFVDDASTKYFSTFEPFDVALYVLLVASILMLVIAFVGTCAANTKSQPLIAFYSIAVVIVIIAEIISLIVFVQFHSKIENDFDVWYKNHFQLYWTNDTLHKELVDHVQAKIGCCGLYSVRDFFTSTSKEIPSSCTDASQFRKPQIIRQDIHSEGCVKKVGEFLDWLLRGWPIPFGMSMLMLVEIIGAVSSVLFLLHMIVRKYYSYDDEDDESSGLISNKKQNNSSLPAVQDTLKQVALTEDLPKPKVFRIPKALEDKTFGFSIVYDHTKTAHLTRDIDKGSNAALALLTPNCHIIEMNGMMVHGISSEEVNMKLESIDNELRMLVIEEEATIIYKTNKVAVNLRNVQGVTSIDVDYRPRLCVFSKGHHGFGFHLLYLEDRKGEFIEDLAAGGPAENSGLKIGDRIVEVNGVNIEHEKSKEVVSRIRQSGDTITMLVLDPKADGYFRKKAVTVTASLAVDYFSNMLQNSQQTSKRKRRSNRDVKPRYCRLVKGAREDFGLYVVIDNTRIGQVIRWVDCGGPADRAGLHIGDRIVEVNGENVEYESHQKLIDAIALSKKTSHFIVVDEEYDKVFKRNKPRLCRIFKENGLFGFAVSYVDKRDGHYVDEIDANGPADRAGLKVGDRVIQINNTNVCHDDNEQMLSRLRACDAEVVLLVIDSRSDKHYRNIKKFKQSGMDDIDYDTISIPEEPLFVPDVEEDTESMLSDQLTLTMADSISMAETKSFLSMTTGVTVQTGSETITSEAPEGSGPRVCTLVKMEHEDHGFFLAVDRDRNGQIIQRIEPGGPADIAGLRNGDRIISVNNNKVYGFTHEQVVQLIKASGNEIVFVVLDARSDDLNSKRRPYLFRIMKGEGGYGFYMWYDDEGHYVEDITINSPADKAGLRSGDRIIEINGVNIEGESHEDVFYRVKACDNTVSLLAVDSKTFSYYKKNNLPVTAFKAEAGFSGYQKITKKKTEKTKKNSVPVQQDIKLVKSDGENFGFHLAYSESFMDDDSTGSHVIHWVEKGGPADMAGIRNGDKIVAINGKDIRGEEHEVVYEKIFESGKNSMILTTEFEKSQGISPPHVIKIVKEDESLGFYLWFDENGHYIEDVTFGSAADKAGLKIGDRLLEVNENDVEDEPHAVVVDMVKESGEKVSLTVISIESDNAQGNILPSTVTVTKHQGSFGFSIVEDDNGIHFDFVKPDGPAEESGISIGDRLLEVNGESVQALGYSNIVSIMKATTSDIQLTVLSSVLLDVTGSIGRMQGKKLLNGGKNVFKQLLGQEKLDYVVEKRKYQEAQGTDLRKNRNGESETEDEGKKIGKSRKKRPKKVSKMRYSKGEDNVAFVNEIADEIDKDYEAATADKEGAYLDDKVKRAGILSAKRRKPQQRIEKEKRRDRHEKRQIRLNEIEQKLGSSKSATTRRHRRQLETKNASRTMKSGGFHLAASKNSLGQQWSFEQTDSRRPGEVVAVNIVNDAIVNTRELSSIVEEDDEEQNTTLKNENIEQIQEAKEMKDEAEIGDNTATELQDHTPNLIQEESDSESPSITLNGVDEINEQRIQAPTQAHEEIESEEIMVDDQIKVDNKVATTPNNFEVVVNEPPSQTTEPVQEHVDEIMI